MIKYQEFNALKAEAWETKTPEEFEKVLVKLREWFKAQELNDEQRTNMTKQVTCATLCPTTCVHYPPDKGVKSVR